MQLLGRTAVGQLDLDASVFVSHRGAIIAGRPWNPCSSIIAACAARICVAIFV